MADIHSSSGSVVAFAAVAETHGGIVFLVGDRAYKMKKPVRFGFLDFTDRQVRRETLLREMELNRRLAPDVYLRVLDVVDAEHTPVDHLLEMRRMPANRRLSTLVRSGVDVRHWLSEIATTVFAFHSDAATGGEIDLEGSLGEVRRNWADNVTEMQPFVGTVLNRDIFERAWGLVEQYLKGRRPLFDARVAAGKIRDGHGDLLADDIFCLDDGVRILDCIEFSDRLRWCDVISDVAFLAMDLERIGDSDGGRYFLDSYQEASGDDAPPSLIHHYVAYRAHVRAKVALLRHAQGDEAAADDAELLLRLCAGHLEEGRVRVVLVGGGPGMGKTTIAAQIGQEHGWPVIRSDVVRKELAGIAPSDHTRMAPHQKGMYSPEMTERTYGEMIKRALEHVGMGHSVVLDATWAALAYRQLARKAAEVAAAELIELRCVCPEACASKRMTDRLAEGRDASDVTPDVARRLSERFEPWPNAIPIDTAASFGDSLRTALDAVR